MGCVYKITGNRAVVCNVCLNVMCKRLGKETVMSAQQIEEKKPKFIISTMPADGLALSGARPSAGTVMTKFGVICIRDQHAKS